MIEKKKKKQLRVSHKYDGKIMAIGHWESLHARLANWARSAQTLRQKALRWEYLLCCGYAPDEKSNRPAFGGEIEHLSHAEFVKKWGVSYVTLKRWHEKVEKIALGIKQEWINRERQRKEAAMNGQPQGAAANGEPLVDDDIPF